MMVADLELGATIKTPRSAPTHRGLIAHPAPVHLHPPA
jgi:hypothetical protein